MRTRRRRRLTIAAIAAASAMVIAACGPVGSPEALRAAPAVAVAAHDHGGHDHATCDAHDGDPSRQGEHCHALALTDPAQATDVAVTSGLWTDPATWGGNAPTDRARVHIPEGVTVRVDAVVPTMVEALRVDGELTFATRTDTEIRVDTLVSSPSGLLTMGTASNPIRAGVTARIVVVDDGPIDRVEDPSALGRGLVLHGTTVIHGASKTPFVELASPASAGDRSLDLTTAPAGWRPGDRIVVAGVDPDGGGDEDVTIASVSGASVTLSRPLGYDHVGPTPDLNVHVANLTRNAVVESEADDVANRGHVMFMHTTEVDVANAGFYRLGRTDKLEELFDRAVDLDAGIVCVSDEQSENVRGRYSVHFHRAGVLDTPAASVRGSVATENPGWAYVNHSSNVDFVGNVAYDVDGAAFNTESGDEIGSFVGNISIRTHGSAGAPVERQGSQDFGHAGHGFWLQGAGVRVEDNVASGATGAAFIFYTEGLVEPGAGRVWFPAANLPFETDLDQVPVVQVPILDFRRNEAYGSVIGTRSYYHRTDVTVGLDEALALGQSALGLPKSRVEDLTLWGNEFGYLTNYTLDTEYVGLRIVGTSGEGVGFDASHVYNRGLQRYEDFDVSGYEIGLIPARSGEIVVDGGRFDNREHDILVPEPRQFDRRVLITGEPRFDGDGTAVAALADMRTLVDADEEWFFLDDRITIDFGPHAGSQLFYAEQVGSNVLFTEQPEIAELDDPGTPVGEAYLGLTNSQLQRRFYNSFGGALASADARSVDGFVGLVGTPAPDPGPLPSADDILHGLIGEGFDFEEREEELPGGEHTITSSDCEEVLFGEEDEELIEECEALFDGTIDEEDIDDGLIADCNELFEEGEDDEEEDDLATILAEELAELDQEEIDEIVAECREIIAEGDEDDDEYLEECQIILDLVGS